MLWIVGDVHGCAKPLERLLRAIRFDPRRDSLWGVGDLVNTGPEPLETLRLFTAAGGRSVLGNHDAYAVRVARGWIDRRPDRLDPLLATPDGEAWIDWLASLPLVRRFPDGGGGPETVLVHAGFHPAWDDPVSVIEEIDARSRDEEWFRLPVVTFATRVRCCTADGDRSRATGPPTECPPPFRPWDDWWTGPERVVHGHWAGRGHYRSALVLGLDSGCVYGGPLTAWCLEEDRIVQVPGQSRRMYS